MRLRHLVAFTFCFIFTLLLFCSPAPGFIHREFTTHEVLDGSTNIIFAKVKSVDPKRLNAVVEVVEDVKGESSLSEIRINVATGWYVRKSTPQKMMRLLKVDMPVLILYLQNRNGGISGIGYTDGTWFRLNVARPEDWWAFSHLCPYMPRTFNGTTLEFLEVLRRMLAGELWVEAAENARKIFVLTGNSTPAIPGTPEGGEPVGEASAMGYEYSAIRRIDQVGDVPLAYEPTRNRSLPDIDQADILWLGYGEVAFKGYLLDKESEEKIKAFVENGGIVVVSGQDSPREQPMEETGWLVGNLKGIERPVTQAFEVTEQGKQIFSSPNTIEPEELYIDDAWTGWDDAFEVLATAHDGSDLVVGTRRHGKGLYIVTSLRNDKKITVEGNKKLIENLLHYAANWSPAL